MSSKAVRALDQKDKTIRILVIVVVFLAFVSIHAHIRVLNTPKEMTVYVPPDISTGGALPIGIANDILAYDFAFTIYSAVNTWTEDGSEEYEHKADIYRGYFGANYVNSMKREARRDAQVNKGRTRTVEYVPNKYKVNALGGNRFEVEMTVRVIDKIRNSIIKDEVITKYFLVVPSNVSKQYNPWQLKIEGEYKPSKRGANDS